MLLNKYTDKELEHVGKGESAREEEDPLDDAQHAADIAAVFPAGHDAFMQHGLADIAVEKGNAADPQGPQGKGCLQEGFVPAPAADIVQGQGPQIHDDHAGAHKQRQLDQGMVDHMQDRTAVSHAGSLRIACRCQQDIHGNPHQDKADLGHGGTGQGPFEIDREQGHQGAQGHGDRAQDQDDPAEHGVPRQSLQGSHQNAVDAYLGQNARKQGRTGGRRYRMRLGQPYMHREHTGFGAETEQDTDTGGPYQDRVLRPGRGSGQIFKVQGPQAVLQQGQTHKQDQAADDGNEQIGISRLNGFRRLLMNDPGKGGEGDDLKKDKGGHQIRREHDALGGAQRHQDKEPVAVQSFPFMGEILPGEQGRTGPHQGGHKAVDCMQSLILQPEASVEDARDLQAVSAPDQQERQKQLQKSDQDHKNIPGVLLPSSDSI